MSNAAFEAIKQLLTPYARHFTVDADDEQRYDLAENLPHSKTMFAFLRVSRGGARLVFYPLQVFRNELRVPALLAPLVKSRCILAFKTVTPAQRAALTALFQTGCERVAAQRALDPARGYYRKPDLDQTFAILEKVPGATVTRRPNDIVVALPPNKKVPASLAARRKSGRLVFKTITPAEHAALAKLLR